MTEWQPTTLGEVVDILDFKRVPLSSAQRARRKGPYPYYGAQGIIDYIDDYIFNGRFILVPEDGENLRSRKLPIAYFAEGRFWVNNHAHIIKAKPGVANDRFVQSTLEASDISPYVTGAAQPKLSQANLRQIPIMLPGPAEQAVIGSILDGLDDLIENNRRRISMLEQMAQAIYKEWFVRFRYPGHDETAFVDSTLGSIPEGWSVTPLSQCAASLVDGDWIETRHQGGNDYRLLQVSNIGIGCFRETGNYRYITAETFHRLRCTAITLGDLLVSRMPDPVGRAWLVDHLAEPAITAVDVAILTPSSPAMGSYLNQVLNSEEYLAHAAAVATGTTRKRITRTVLSQTLVVSPPPDLLLHYHERIAPAAALASRLRTATTALSALRGVLLPKLVTGQIDASHLDIDAMEAL